MDITSSGVLIGPRAERGSIAPAALLAVGLALAVLVWGYLLWARAAVNPTVIPAASAIAPVPSRIRKAETVRSVSPPAPRPTVDAFLATKSSADAELIRAALAHHIETVTVQSVNRRLFAKFSDLDHDRLTKLKLLLLQERMVSNSPTTVAEAESTIQNLLGDRYGEYLVEKGASEARLFLDVTILSALAYDGLELSETQAEQLAYAYSEVHLVPSDPLYRTVAGQSPRPGADIRPYQEEIMAKAAAFLTAEQLAALRASFLRSVPKL